MSMYEMEYTLEDDTDVIVAFDVVGSYIRGSTDCYGCPEEPDEYPEVEIESIKDLDGNEIEVYTWGAMDRILTRAYEYSNE